MKTRTITGAILLAVVLPIIYVGGLPFSVLIGIAALIAAFELLKLGGFESKLQKVIAALTFVLVFLFAFIPMEARWSWWTLGILIFIFLAEIFFVFVKKEQLTNADLFIVVYIGFASRALLMLREASLAMFLFFVLTVVVTDSAAYFIGIRFGKKKLAPNISPKKTVAGAVGGLVVAAAFAIGFGLWRGLFDDMWLLVGLAIAIPILAQIGDLIASGIKRAYGVKDFSALFPGHGGVLDRIDSQLIAAMFAYLLSEWVNFL